MKYVYTYRGIISIHKLLSIMWKYRVLCLVLLVLAVSGCAKLIISQSLKALNSTTDYYAIESPHNGETHCSINMMVDGEEYSFKSLWNIQKLPNIIIPGFSLEYPNIITITASSIRYKMDSFYIDLDLVGNRRWEPGRYYSVGSSDDGQELTSMSYWCAPGKSKSYLNIKTGTISIEPLDEEYSVRIQFEFDATSTIDGSLLEFRDGVIISEFRHKAQPNNEIFSTP